jgi:flagellar biosynthesis chaperone FliJ
MFNDKFILLADTVKDLGISCEQLGIQYTSKLSTLEVTVSQQSIQIKSLEKQLKEMDTFAQEGWDLAETYTIQIKKLQKRIDEFAIRVFGGM